MNKKLSAYSQINGFFDPLATPLGPPGCKILAHEKAGERNTWSAHGKEGYYLGPDLESYRCFKVYIPSTRGIRSVDTISWYPHDITVPTVSTSDMLHEALQNILQVLQTEPADTLLAAVQPEEHEAIVQLVGILNKKLPTPHTDSLPPTEQRDHHAQPENVPPQERWESTVPLERVQESRENPAPPERV